MSEVLHPRHRKNSHSEGIYLNIFQPSHDRHLGRMARRMRDEKLIEDTFPNLSGLNIVLTKGKRERVEIRTRGDLEPFATANGRKLADFEDRNEKIIADVELMQL